MIIILHVPGSASSAMATLAQKIVALHQKPAEYHRR